MVWEGRYMSDWTVSNPRKTDTCTISLARRVQWRMTRAVPRTRSRCLTHALQMSSNIFTNRCIDRMKSEIESTRKFLSTRRVKRHIVARVKSTSGVAVLCGRFEVISWINCFLIFVIDCSCLNCASTQVIYSEWAGSEIDIFWTFILSFGTGFNLVKWPSYRGDSAKFLLWSISPNQTVVHVGLYINFFS